MWKAVIIFPASSILAALLQVHKYTSAYLNSETGIIVEAALTTTAVCFANKCSVMMGNPYVYEANKYDTYILGTCMQHYCAY